MRNEQEFTIRLWTGIVAGLLLFLLATCAVRDELIRTATPAACGTDSECAAYCRANLPGGHVPDYACDGRH